MVFSKKRGAREVVWGPEEPWVEPKKEIVLGPAGYANNPSSSSEKGGESALGFLGAMAGSAESNSSGTETRPSSSQYGWEPSSSSSSTQNSSSSPYSSSTDNLERLERLHRKMERMVDQLDLLEKKIERIESKLGVSDF